MTSSGDIADLPAFLAEHADTHPDPTAVRGVLRAYEDTVSDMLSHPRYSQPPQPETAVFGGLPTYERIHGRCDGLLLALKWLAVALDGQPDYQEEWRPSSPPT